MARCQHQLGPGGGFLGGGMGKSKGSYPREGSWREARAAQSLLRAFNWPEDLKGPPSLALSHRRSRFHGDKPQPIRSTKGTKGEHPPPSPPMIRPMSKVEWNLNLVTVDIKKSCFYHISQYNLIFLKFFRLHFLNLQVNTLQSSFSCSVWFNIYNHFAWWIWMHTLGR